MCKAKLSIDLFIRQFSYGSHHVWTPEANPVSAETVLMSEEQILFLVRVGTLALKKLGKLADITQVIKLGCQWQQTAEPRTIGENQFFPVWMTAYAVLDGINEKERVQSYTAEVWAFFEETPELIEEMAENLTRAVRKKMEDSTKKLQQMLDARSALLS